MSNFTFENTMLELLPKAINVLSALGVAFGIFWAVYGMSLSHRGKAQEGIKHIKFGLSAGAVIYLATMLVKLATTINVNGGGSPEAEYSVPIVLAGLFLLYLSQEKKKS